MNFTSHSEADTDQFGQQLAARLTPGTVIALNGPLGAGKTRLVKAIAAPLGVDPQNVTSPTFVLVNEYLGGTMPIYHFDVYRLKDIDEFLGLGPDEYFEATECASSNGEAASPTTCPPTLGRWRSNRGRGVSGSFC